MRLFFVLFIIIYVLNSAPLCAELLSVDGHQLHFETWGSKEETQKPTIVLLSGPIDTWHSDSAWWASLGPKLAKNYRVIALDRAGVVVSTPDARVGYQHFASDLELVFNQLNIDQATLVAFASSNISVQLFLAQNPEQRAIKQVIMIDPDVLSPFSITRYKNDAAQFKQNLTSYIDYIQAGSYIARTEQKNATEIAQLKALGAVAASIDWQYVEKLQQARLNIANQANLFREIAIYDQDLDAAAATQWPATMPLIVIDTDFEAKLIDEEKDLIQKQDLVTWQQDARQYYKSLTVLHPTSRYIASASREHWYQIAELTRLVELLEQQQTSGKGND